MDLMDLRQKDPNVQRLAGLGHQVGNLCSGRRGGMLLAFHVPDEFSYTDGAQTEVLGPASLVIVAATDVHIHLGAELPVSSLQVLLVDSALALHPHTRRIINPWECTFSSTNWEDLSCSMQPGSRKPFQLG